MDNTDNLILLASLLDPYAAQSELDFALTEIAPAKWQALSELASQQGVSLRFYQTLNTHGFPQTFPQALRSSLKQAYLKNALRNTLILRQAGLLLEKLQQEQVPTIALKGIYLVENINRSIAERHFGDIDLLVKRADLPKAIACAQDCGFKPSTYFDPADQDIDIKHVPPMFNDDGLPVEIHWTLLEEDEPFSIDTAELWQRAMPVKVAGVDVLALSPEHLAAHLCLHFTYQHHLSLGLKGLLDVADALAHFQDQFDWPLFISTQKDWQSERVAWLTLKLLQQYTKTIIPQQVLSALQPIESEAWVLEQAKTQIINANSNLGGVTPDLAEFSKANNFFSKLKIGTSRIFLPRRVIARLYKLRPNSPEILKGYFLRFRDLLRVYGQRIWHPQSQSLDWPLFVGQAESQLKLSTWLRKRID